MRAVKRMMPALAIAAMAAACAGNGRGYDHRPKTMVEVRNDNWSDMTVYAVRSGVRYRLGSVTSMQLARFPLPPTLSGVASDVTLMADPIGSNQTYRTGRITFTPGQRIELRLQNNLAISSYAVWGP